MTRFRKFFVGASYGFIGSVVQRVLLAAGAIAYARLLGVQEYGVWVNLAALVNLLMTLSQFGVTTAFTAFIPQYAANDPERIPSVVWGGLTLVIGMLTLLAIALGGGADLLSRMAYHGAIRPDEIRSVIPYLAFLTLNMVLLAAVYGFQDFRRYAMQTSVVALLALTCGVPGVLLGGVGGLVAGMAIAYALSTLLVTRLLGTYRGDWLRVDAKGVRRAGRELVRFALPTFLGGLFVAPAYWIGNLLLVRSHGAADSGYFGVANAIAQLVLFLPSTLASPLIPILSQAAAEEQPEQFSSFVRRNLRMVWCISIPVGVLLGSAAPVIIGILYGAPYAPASETYAILACSNLLIAIQSVVGFVLIARRRMWQGFVANLIWFFLFLAFAIWLIPARGHIGFALSFLASYGLYSGVVLAILKKHVDFTLASAGTARIALMTGLAMVAVIGIAVGVPTALTNALLSVVSAVLFGIAAWAWVLKADDRDLVRRTVAEYAQRIRTLQS